MGSPATWGFLGEAVPSWAGRDKPAWEEARVAHSSSTGHPWNGATAMYDCRAAGDANAAGASLHGHCHLQLGWSEPQMPQPFPSITEGQPPKQRPCRYPLGSPWPRGASLGAAGRGTQTPFGVGRGQVGEGQGLAGTPCQSDHLPE